MGLVVETEEAKALERKALLEKKARSYLFDRQRAYKKVFGSSKDLAIKKVLEDLKAFCRADESCFDPDPRIHAVLEGRREVILRIGHHIDLKSEQLWDLYRGDTYE